MSPDFGRRLMLARVRRLGMTQPAFAERFGLVLPVLADVEGGTIEPDAALVALVEAIEGGAAIEPVQVEDVAALPAEAPAPATLVRRPPRPHVILPRVPDPDAERRDLWRRWRRAEAAIAAENAQRDPDHQHRHYPFPRELAGLACGARTRRGGLCRRTDLYAGGRCKFHGGLSTGPKTEEGREQQRRNLARRWAHKRGGDDAQG